MPLGVFFYLVGMLIANTLRHTAMVSGAGSYVCVMVEARRIELLSESASGRFSTGVVYCFDSTSDGAIDKPVRVITGIVPRSAPGGHGSFF